MYEAHGMLSSLSLTVHCSNRGKNRGAMKYVVQIAMRTITNAACAPRDVYANCLLHRKRHRNVPHKITAHACSSCSILVLANAISKTRSKKKLPTTNSNVTIAHSPKMSLESSEELPKNIFKTKNRKCDFHNVMLFNDVHQILNQFTKILQKCSRQPRTE